MQEVNNRVAAIGVGRVAGREVNEDVAIRRITLQICLERFSVYLHLLDGALLFGDARLRVGTRLKPLQAGPEDKQR